MNLELIGIAAEIVGALAVVVTLLFLAVEVRNNRNATESASIDALATGFNAINAHVIDDPQLAEIWQTGLAEPEQLTEVDRIRLVHLVQSYINHFTSLKKYHDSGVLPEDEWLAYSSSVAAFMNTPGGKWISEKMAITPAVAFEIKQRENDEFAYRFLSDA